MSDPHRLMIRFSLDHLRFLEDQIYPLDEIRCEQTQLVHSFRQRSRDQSEMLGAPRC
jgi:hypothetical protein